MSQSIGNNVLQEKCINITIKKCQFTTIITFYYCNEDSELGFFLVQLPFHCFYLLVFYLSSYLCFSLKIFLHSLKIQVLRRDAFSCVYVLSCVQLFATLWTAFQAPLSMGFPRQEYWSGLPFPPPGDLPDPGIKPAFSVSLMLAGRFFTT